MRRPREPSLLYPKKTKNPNPSPIGNRFGFFLFGGRGWIRTTEAESSRFTVCPHWPLGNTPIFFSQSVPDCLYILPLPRGFVKFFAANYFAVKSKALNATNFRLDFCGFYHKANRPSSLPRLQPLSIVQFRQHSVSLFVRSFLMPSALASAGTP